MREKPPPQNGGVEKPQGREKSSGREAVESAIDATAEEAVAEKSATAHNLTDAAGEVSGVVERSWANGAKAPSGGDVGLVLKILGVDLAPL